MSDLEQLQTTLVVLHATQAEFDRLNAKALKLKTDIRQYELKAMQIMNEMGLSYVGIAGLLAKIKSTTQYNVKDWQKLYALIKRDDAFELLHKRISSTAVRERFKNGGFVEGVEPVEVPSLVLTLDGNMGGAL